MHGGIQFRRPRVIRFRDRAFLGAESLGGIASDVRHRFGIDPSGGGQRIAHRSDTRIVAYDVGESFRANIARASVPNPIGRLESRAGFWPLALFIVAETERGDSVAFDFDHELGGIGGAA